MYCYKIKNIALVFFNWYYLTSFLSWSEERFLINYKGMCTGRWRETEHLWHAAFICQKKAKSICLCLLDPRKQQSEQTICSLHTTLQRQRALTDSMSVRTAGKHPLQPANPSDSGLFKQNLNKHSFIIQSLLHFPSLYNAWEQTEGLHQYLQGNHKQKATSSQDEGRAYNSPSWELKRSTLARIRLELQTLSPRP